MAFVDLNPQAYTCTPDSVLSSVPCLNCLSEKELLAGLVAIFAEYQQKTVAEVVSDSTCFACLSRREMLQAIVTFFGSELLGRDYDLTALIAQYNCLLCLGQKQLEAALVSQLCNFDLVATPT